MKKCWIFLVLGALLTGCAAQQAAETVEDVYAPSEKPDMQQVVLELPQEATAPAMEGSDAGALYFCDGYTLTVQTMSSGDLSATLRALSGYAKEDLTVMQTLQNGLRRYDCVWTAAGETGLQVCRTAVLDDGYYHYILTAMTDQDRAGELQETFRQLFDSFTLAPDTDA